MHPAGAAAMPHCRAQNQDQHATAFCKRCITTSRGQIDSEDNMFAFRERVFMACDCLMASSSILIGAWEVMNATCKLQCTILCLVIPCLSDICIGYDANHLSHPSALAAQAVSLPLTMLIVVYAMSNRRDAECQTWSQLFGHSLGHHTASTHGSVCPASPQYWS